MLSSGSSYIPSISSTGYIAETVTTSGLISYYDASDSTSWVDGDSTLYDLSGNNVNLGPYGGIATSTFSNGAVGWNFDAVGKYFAGGNYTMPAKNLTMEAWIHPAASEVSSGDRGTVIKIIGGQDAYMSWNKGNQYLSNYWYSHTPDGYHETIGPSSRGAWHHWCSVWSYGQGYLYQYVDGNVNKTATQGNSSAGTSINIGRESDERQFSGGIAIIRLYNRALRPDEVMDNFFAERGRFGV